MFKHKVKNDLPEFKNKASTKADKEVNARDKIRKEAIKEHADKHRKSKTSDITPGELVLIKDVKPKSKLSSYYENQPYRVIKSYPAAVKITNNKQTYVRNKAHIKKYVTSQMTKQPQPPQTSPAKPKNPKPPLFTVPLDQIEEIETMPTDKTPLSTAENTMDPNDTTETIPYGEEDEEVPTHHESHKRTRKRMPNQWYNTDEWEL